MERPKEMSGANEQMSADRKNEALCADCAAPAVGAHFCPECRRIQPLAPTTDHFAFFGLPKKLRVDDAGLEKTFYALSRQFHPDYFMNASDEERQASLDRAAKLNEAYRTLRDPIGRVKYLLSLAGYKEAEKKAPPDLLEEVFELNMQVEELKAAKKMDDEEEIDEASAALQAALASLSGKLQTLDEALFAQFDKWDAATGDGDFASADPSAAAAAKEPTAEQKTALDALSELLSHRAYLANLTRDVTEVLSTE